MDWMLILLQIQRRLAQNREAARKSRLRKKVCKTLSKIFFEWLITLFTPLEHNLFYLFIGRFCVQAYVQQLETSRLKLIHLEQELDRARQQV